jgi:hypothetical protein
MTSNLIPKEEEQGLWVLVHQEAAGSQRQYIQMANITKDPWRQELLFPVTDAH